MVRWKKRLCKIHNIKQIWIFPPNNWEPGFGFGFASSSVQNTDSSDSQWLKNWEGQFLKREINLLDGEIIYKSVSSTEPPLFGMPYTVRTNLPKLLYLLIFCIYLLNFSLEFFIMIFFVISKFLPIQISKTLISY